MNNPQEDTGRLDRGDGVALAWARLDGRGPTVVFLPGFASDMSGGKATALAEACRRAGRALLRFDYSGHGASGGAFADGTIGRWRDDALAAIDRLTEGPLILVGSSMGGWIALLAALARPGRVAGLVGVAAAPDFTERLMWQAMAPAEQAALLAAGHLDLPSQYGPPTRITRALI
ncbi:MAG TPA: alpha/beta hydrolase, partial [Acetobacteraceae bacterium]|nr:alpha/beta hydrolase [Acetobacteraceae bacterium]